jgi:hypothetical protein
MTKDKIISKKLPFYKLPKEINIIIFYEYLRNENLNYNEKINYFNFVVDNLLSNNIKFIQLSLLKYLNNRYLFKDILKHKNIKFKIKTSALNDMAQLFPLKYKSFFNNNLIPILILF